MNKETIIEIYDDETISARDLYDIINNKKERFSKWFNRQLQYGFIENVDFYSLITCRESQEGGRLVKRKLIDYRISIDMSIIICEHIKYNDVEKILNFLIISKNNSPIRVYKNKPRFEYEFGDMLDAITGYKWDRQVNIDNGKYRVDFMLGYELAVEYDEEHHKYTLESDRIRQEYIQNWLLEKYKKNIDPFETWKIPFIRVSKGNELEGLKNIMDYLIHSEMICLIDGKLVRMNPQNIYDIL